MQKITVGIVLTSDKSKELEEGLGRISLTAEGKNSILITFKLTQPVRTNSQGFELREGDTLLISTNGGNLTPEQARLMPLQSIAIGKICIWAIMNILSDSILPKVLGGSEEDIMIVHGPTDSTFPYQYEWDTTDDEVAVLFEKEM